MNRFKHIFFAAGIAAGLALGGMTVASFASANDDSGVTMPKSAAEYGAEAAKSDQEASTLESKAEHHARMAALYRAQVSGGSKQETSFRSLATHCERLAASYRQAARDARAMALSLREMAKVA